MLIQFAAAAAAQGGAEGNPYGLTNAVKDGGPLTWATLGILVIMSLFSFYILFSKLFEQQKIISQGHKVRQTFWNNNSLREAASKLEKDSAYRQIIDDGLRAEEQHTLLTDPIDQHDWTLGALSRSRNAIDYKLGGGLAFLATVGATAPFIGLFGTVIGILSALVGIGAAGQASIDAVAGPVGEALIMTAIGLAVAVPAVLAYNWLQRRNKAISEDLAAFVADVHGWMASAGKVRPNVRSAASHGAPTGARIAGTGVTTAGQVGGVATK